MTVYIFSKREEIANAVTHAAGAAMAIAGMVLLIVFSSLHGSPWHIISFTIFGATLSLLYVVSTLYHAMPSFGVKHLFRKFDHMSIFLLIAGTYTPFCLTVLRGWTGWVLFGIIWGAAIGGILLKVFHTGKKEFLSTLMYILMGWMVVLFIKPVYLSMSAMGFAYLIAGGCLYTLGAFFFIKDKIPYYHSIWHLFVLGGSICHFFAVLTLL
jgi:hemolysin III